MRRGGKAQPASPANTAYKPSLTLQGVPGDGGTGRAAARVTGIDTSSAIGATGALGCTKGRGAAGAAMLSAGTGGVGTGSGVPCVSTRSAAAGSDDT